MNRSELLTAAQDAVAHRPRSYGSPERNFTRISRHWNVYLTGKYGAGSAPLLDAVDVAAMMALMKIARLEETPDHIDSWVDLAGYAACGAECATVIEHDADEVAEAIEHDADEVVEAIYNATEGAPEPRFKAGDEVRYSGAPGRVFDVSWYYPESGEYLLMTDSSGFLVDENEVLPRFKVGDDVIFTGLPSYPFTIHRIASDGRYSIRDMHGLVFHDYDESELTSA